MAATIDQALEWLRGGWKQSKYAKTNKVGLGIDTDGYYGFQCKDFVNAYLDYVVGWIPSGNAIDLWTQALPNSITRIANTKDFIPQPGDVFVMSIGKYWHTGVVLSNITMITFRSVDQNWFASNSDVGNIPAVIEHKYDNFVGVLRPRFKEESMSQSDAKDVEAYYWNGLNRRFDKGEVSQAEINGLIGKKPSDALEGQRQSPEWLYKNWVILVGFTQAQEKIKELQATISKMQSNNGALTADEENKLQVLTQSVNNLLLEAQNLAQNIKKK